MLQSVTSLLVKTLAAFASAVVVVVAAGFFENWRVYTGKDGEKSTFLNRKFLLQLLQIFLYFNKSKDSKELQLVTWFRKPP